MQYLHLGVVSPIQGWYLEGMKVKDIPAHADLDQTQDDVRFTLQMLGCEDDYTYVFSTQKDGEYTAAWGCYRLGLDAPVWVIL